MKIQMTQKKVFELIFFCTAFGLMWYAVKTEDYLAGMVSLVVMLLFVKDED